MNISDRIQKNILFKEWGGTYRDTVQSSINSAARRKLFYGLNTTVLGLVLERATGKSLNDLFKERIGDAYGIKGLSYVKPNDIKLIPGYTGRDGFLREVRDGELDIFGGDVPRYYPEDKLFLGGEGKKRYSKWIY